MNFLFEKVIKLPRVSLAITPTPLESMPNLTKVLCGPNLFVKRDDLTGLALGGNKARQLEFYLGDAQDQGSDVILTTGAVQSNFVRTVAAAAAKLGIDCHVQLEERVSSVDEVYRNSGNVLLDRLLGATLHLYQKGGNEEDADQALQLIASHLRSHGKSQYIMSLSLGHPPLGALGYIVCAQEILEQTQKLSIPIEEIICASGSSSTHAGLVFGLRMLNSNIKVIGVCVRRSAKLQSPRVFNRCIEIAEFLGIDLPVTLDDILTVDCTLFPGYGRLNKMTVEALKLSASLEGLILDPVYTGKVMASLINRVREKIYSNNSNILFLHTGGQPGLFAYEPELRLALDS